MRGGMEKHLNLLRVLLNRITVKVSPRRYTRQNLLIHTEEILFVLFFLGNDVTGKFQI